MKRLCVVLGAGLAVWSVTGGAADNLDGFAEFKPAGALIVDGQKVVATPKTSFKGCASIAAATLGQAVKVDGNRLADGSVEAARVTCEAWTVSSEEQEMISGSNAAEKAWVSAGRLAFSDGEGGTRTVGAILKGGPEVARVKAMVAKLAPPYVGAAKFRTYVVDTKEWNAMVMPNGAVWVYRGILKDMDDQELAIVLGHEIAHYTHHHSLKGAQKRKKNNMIGGAVSIGGRVAGGAATQMATSVGSGLAVTALNSGYGRDLEDQADRVGLRYTFAGGYDVKRAPGLWQKFLEKYGQESKMTNFFFSDHSRASARKKNLEREIAWNYAAPRAATR